uniref:C-C motif chemokine n=1 Tax=Canis lupus dingo TaxID=286419 RepID=A0A8C0K6G6_CANLU
MKVSVATISLFLLIIITLQKQPAGMTFNKESSLSFLPFSLGGPYHPAECCFRYITRAIPRHRITDYFETSSQCSRAGIIFITKNGHSICANPSDDWVQDYIKDLRRNE